MNRPTPKIKSLNILTFFTNKSGKISLKNFNINRLSASASSRLQLFPAVQSALNIFEEIRCWSLHSNDTKSFFAIKPSQICLVGKLSANTDELVNSMTIANLAAIVRLKNRGSKVVVQLCDNVFHRKDALTDLYTDIFPMADHVIFPCKALREVIKEYLPENCQTTIIKDPWQLKSLHDFNHLSKETTCRIIWFGSNKNAKYMAQLLSKILSNCKSHPHFEITFLSTKYSHDLIQHANARIPKTHSKWTFRFVEWSLKDQPEQLENELSRCHLSIIPSDPEDPLKAGVSHNRLVDSVRGGCIPIASPMKSYREIPQLGVLSKNIPESIDKVVKDYDNYCKRISHAREKLLKQFDPNENFACWEKLWTELNYSKPTQNL